MRRILLVDDNEESALTMFDFLRANNFECLLATSGEKALQLIGDDIALVVLDIDLPDISGFDLLRRIKTLHPNLPVMLISANQGWESETKAYELGAKGFFQKPIDLAQFLQVVKSFLTGGER